MADSSFFNNTIGDSDKYDPDILWEPDASKIPFNFIKTRKSTDKGMLTTTTSRYVKFLYQTIALFRSSYKEDGKIINEFKLLEVSTPEVININENSYGILMLQVPDCSNITNISQINLPKMPYKSRHIDICRIM